MKQTIKPLLCGGAVLLFAAGCAPTIKTQNEVTIKPVTIDLNVNLNVKVDQALTDALSDSQKAKATATTKDDRERQERRERFQSRRAKLDQWRKEGKIGENNRGQAELLVKPAEVTGDVTTLIAAENQDRAIVFANIAKTQNTTPEFVGQHWATKMAKRVPAGTMLQDASGKWQKKMQEK